MEHAQEQQNQVLHRMRLHDQLEQQKQMLELQQAQLLGGAGLGGSAAAMPVPMVAQRSMAMGSSSMGGGGLVRSLLQSTEQRSTGMASSSFLPMASQSVHVSQAQ
eukprot:2502963-Alexandrium_andersonii.AAC.1